MSEGNSDASIKDIERQLEDPANYFRRLELCEQGIELADALNDSDAGFSFRQQLMDVAEFSGHPDRTLNAVAWCISKCDEDPDRFSIMNVLWQYKWVVGNIFEFHGMSRAVIDETIDDLDDRYCKVGWGRGAAAKLRLLSARNMGDSDRLERLYEEWVKAPYAAGSDCSACNTGFKAEMLLAMGRVDEALSAAKPVLSGKSRCASEPQDTISNFLEPLIKVGQHSAAVRYHNRGVPMMPNDAHLMRVLARHVEFLTSTHNLDAARALLQRRIAAAMPMASQFNQMFVFAAARRLMTRLRETGFEGSALVLPSPLREEIHDDAASLEKFFKTKAGDLAGRFDARNANKYCSEIVNSPAYLTDKPVPLDPPRKRRTAT